MAQRKLERIVRTRKLTPEEVARDREIRRKVQEEFPPVERHLLTGPSSLSEALRKAIRGSGRSVYQIAKESDVSQIVISRFLSGERDIRMATADKLAEALGITLELR
jgi:ribosome-binding protein aMBF1 (putative translation factor)